MAKSERFVLEVIDGKLRTVANDAQDCALLARLHGLDGQAIQSDEMNVPFDVADHLEGRSLLEAGQAYVESVAKDCGVAVVACNTIAGDSNEIAYLEMHVCDAAQKYCESALDISDVLRSAGYRFGAKLFDDGRIFALIQDGARVASDRHLLRVEEKLASSEDAQKAQALTAIRSAFPDPDKLICSMSEFLETQGVDSLHEEGRRNYKGYACGPWTSAILLNERDPVPYSGLRAREVNASWFEDVVAIQVGSIVEGSDAEVSADPLFFPFTQEKYDAALSWVDDEVESICAENSIREQREQNGH